jgi:hypothetical protein
LPRATRTPACSPAVPAALMLLWAGAPALAQDSDGNATAPYDLDWGLALRGAYSTSTVSGAKFEGTVAPEFTFTRHGVSDTSSVSGDSAVTVDNTGKFRLDNLHAGVATTFEANPWTTFDGSADLTALQLETTDSSLPTGTATSPLEITGEAETSVTRNLGHFDLTATLRGTRFTEGPTTLGDGTVIDNTFENYWAAEGELRLGYELTPLLSVFAEADRLYQKFDILDPTLLVFRDNMTTTLRGGVSYERDSTFSGELSTGRAIIDYADPSLLDQAGWVADGEVRFKPTPTLSLDGTLETTIMPSDTLGDTDVEYIAAATARYQVNPWLTLRGMAGVDHTVTLGTGDTDTLSSVGAGLDFEMARHTVWSADYLFTRETITGSPTDDTHEVTVGVKFKR